MPVTLAHCFSFSQRFTLILLILAMVACSSSRELKPVDLEDFDEEGKLSTLWSTKIWGGQGKYYHQFRLAQDDAFVYAASFKGKIYKLAKENGKKVLKVKLDEALTAGIAVDENQMYVATENGVLLALDKTSGEQKWAFTLRSELVSAPVSDGEAVYLHASNGDVYRINAATGEQQWRVSTNVPALSLRGNAEPLLIPQLVIVGTAGGKVALIERDTGKLFAEPKVASAEGDTEIERMVDVDGTPFFDKGKLYAASFQGQLIALDMQAGKQLWSAKASTFQSLAVDFESVYLSAADSVVSAYHQNNGELKWVQEGLLRRKVTAPKAYSSYLLVSDYKGYIHVISQIDGHFVARRKISGSGVKSPALVDGSTFYVIANNGRLKAYQLEL